MDKEGIFLDVASLGQDETGLSGEASGDLLDLGDAEDMSPAGPIRYRLKASMAQGDLVVRGRVEQPVRFLCVRCAEPFVETVADAEFLRVIEAPNKDEPLDLTPDIRETIILAFPTRPLCSRDCRGLCPRCGTNLNTGACGCAPASSDGRWSSLDRWTRK